jgi:CheY-like chemotaxis protein
MAKLKKNMPVCDAPRHCAPASSCRVLLADDHKDTVESLAMLLELAGYEICTVEDGQSTLEAIRTFRPDVVLLDIGMPNLDGYEVARLVRADETHNQLWLVALTGYGREQDRRLAKEAGFDHHLVKPVTFDALRTLLASLELPRHPTVQYPA